MAGVAAPPSSAAMRTVRAWMRDCRFCRSWRSVLVCCSSAPILVARSPATGVAVGVWVGVGDAVGWSAGADVQSGARSCPG